MHYCVCYCFSVYFNFSLFQFAVFISFVKTQGDHRLYLVVQRLHACMCVYTQAVKFSIISNISSKNTCLLRPHPEGQELFSYVQCIDCLQDQYSASMFDSFPLVTRLTVRSLIEFFGHWFPKWVAERQSINVQVTWPSLGNVLYLDVVAYRKLTVYYSFSILHTRTHMLP